LKDAFDARLYALVARHRDEHEPAQEAALRETAARCSIPTVAGNEVLYHQRARRPLQDVVTCIRHGVALAEAERLTRANAEHVLHALSAFETLFADDPGSVARTREVAERCRFSLDGLRYVYPSEQLPDGTTSAQWLR